MSAPDGLGSGPNPGLFTSLRSFWSVALAIFYTRLDLVTAELEDEAKRAIKLLLAGLVSVLSLMGAFFFAMYFLIALFWDTEYRLWVIGGIFAVYFLIGLLLFLIARDIILNRPRFLSQTIAELRRDAEGLSRPLTKKEETKP
jgi:uncharacterized membrane protein YqjE